MSEEILGVDIGGVIIDRVNDRADTSFFGDRFLETTAVPGAFEALAKLQRERFRNRIRLVSKCGLRTEGKTRQWLSHHKFHSRTGIWIEDVHFCRERRDKAGTCERLGITHFIDDRLEVLGYLASVPNCYLFHPREEEVQKLSHFPTKATRVESWKEVLDLLLPKA